MVNNFVKQVIENGGSIHPLLLPSTETGGTGIMNPSIFIDGDKILCNIRHVNYTLFHCEGEQLFGNRHGPLAYINPENDVKLRTNNFLCELNKDFTIKTYAKIDTTKLDIEPVWEFIGLEDARVVRWEDKLFFTGVRRDTKTNGEGRMELSEIVDNKEIRRDRIEPPNDPNSYCEKNWMPVLDMPYHYIKWTNPTELVKVDRYNKTSETIHLKNGFSNLQNLRGSSHIIPYKNKRICIIHECDLWKNKLNQKDAKYTHRFVMWDLDWNIEWISDSFSFMDGEIEFCCGLAEYNNELLISFGFQDNAAFILRMPTKYFDTFANIKRKDYWRVTPYPTIEITTSIPPKGCVVDCAFCPQRTLLNVYNSEKMMEYEKFVDMIDRLPSNEIRITFSGFTEPFLNRRTADMILYAHNKGHKISVFTTGVGLRIEDIDKIKHINFSNGPNSGFTLHLPDEERIAKHPITKEYIEVVEYIKSIENQINGFNTMSMGMVHESVKHIYPTAHIPTFWSRAGNLLGEAIIKPELEKIKDRFQHMNHGDKEMTCNCLEDLYHNVLLPDGRLSLCCMDYGLKHILGNLWEQEYEDIIPKPFTCFELCNNCENGIEPKNKKND
jgi:organic radical activating enzyme